MKFGSLFAGIGGIDLGLERAGMECAWQVEIDDYCTRILEKHWPDVQRFGDVRDCGGHNLPPVDLIAGGFPCQPHSVAGKRRGAADDRNLWPEFIRVIRELKPRYVLAENVPGIIATYIDTVLFDLESEGYTCATLNLPAVAFDAPHRRERIFIVANANEQGFPGPTRGRIGGIREAEGTLQRGDFGGGNAAPRTHWTVESGVGRVASRIPNRVDRLRGLGNAVVPQVAEWIGRRIMEFDGN